jgi:3-hydroxybutyryl-CoA dehydrogenase
MKNISVIGSGTMGNGIAHLFAQHGFKVALVDLSPDQLNKGMATIAKNMDRQIANGTLSEADKDASLQRITPYTSLADGVKEANLVVEAATEKIDIKLDLFRQLDLLAPPTAVLASNTSSISITQIAAVTQRPSQVIGMHFMNPVPVMKLVEVITGYATSHETTTRIMDLSLQLEKVPVEVQDYPGFVANRILMPMINEAIYTLHEGVAGVSEIDTVILMFDRGSYSTITQKVSRVLTPGVTYKGQPKTHGNIISLSLDPNREDVSPIDEYIVYESEKVQVNDLNDGIQRVLKSMDIFTNDNGDIEPIEVDVYSDRLINSSTLIKLGCETSKVDKVIMDSTLVNMLLGIEVPEAVKEKLMAIDSSKVKRTKDEPQTKEEKELDKKVEDIRIKIKKVLDNIVENAVEISEINNCESDDIIDTLTMIDNKGYCNEVIHEVGVSCEMVKQIIMMGGLSYKLLNTIISSYNKEKVVFF